VPLQPRGGDRPRGLDIGEAFRHEDAQGKHLVNRGVRRIAAPVESGEQHLALDSAAQSRLQTGRNSARLQDAAYYWFSCPYLGGLTVFEGSGRHELFFRRACSAYFGNDFQYVENTLICDLLEVIIYTERRRCVKNWGVSEILCLGP
jgi:hypothetical protein